MTVASAGAIALALVRLGRLHFLFGGVLLHLLGVAIALYAGAPFDITAFIWGQIAITATQLMTHYANDYYDLAADRANRTPTDWSGGSRVLVKGVLPPRLALYMALLLAAVALLANLVLSLTVRPGLLTFSLLASAQCAAWFYSAPPLRLHSRGLGELTTMLVVTLLTPLTGYVLQTGQVALLPLLAAVPLGGCQFAMLLAIEFPDAEGDRTVNKRTLVVSLGAGAAMRLYVAVICAIFVVLPLLVRGGLLQPVAWAAAAVSPLALWLLYRVWRGDWRNPQRWNGFGFHTILLLIIMTMAELAAFVWLLATR
ncbi:MAG: prenyltransferase [Chloroflexota bacterium]|nr:prenyltransferase [Chloroflexota bacterium]